ncbi:MAG TPA: dihydrofolate reductase family protein [Actinomycetota bacterium]|nr:dihydrofolate reductase family protein [Actinomycetota bacterium]
MSKLRLDISTSLVGFVAGPDPTVEEPLGVGGEALHEWAYGLEVFRRRHGDEGGEVNVSNDVMEESLAGVGATIMGRNMFGGGPGPWGDEPWKGWWGDEPPFRMPVFVLTHHPRPPLEKTGTTFTFVTDGIEAALAQARDAAGGADVTIAGGADVAQQYLAAGLLDEMQVHVAPVLLGGGTRLFDRLGSNLPRVEQVKIVEAPGVTHLKYRVVKG